MSLSTFNSEQRQAALYLRWLLLAAMLPLALLGAFNYLIDPLLLFRSPRIEGVNGVKTQLFDSLHRVKPLWAAEEDWQRLVLGTSRAGGGLPEQHPYLRDRSFNFALPGLRFTSSAALYQRLAERREIESVLITLDFFSFNTASSLVEVRDAELLDSMSFQRSDGKRNWQLLHRFTVRMNGLFSWQSLQHSMDTLSQQGTVLAGNAGRFDYSSRGYWQQTLPKQLSQRESFRRVERQYIQRGWFPPPQRVYRHASGDKSSWRAYRELLGSIYAGSGDATLMISPLHNRFLLAMQAAGVYQEFERWKRELLRINSSAAAALGREPFVLWDFADASEVLGESVPEDNSRMRFFIDGQHYQHELGWMLLDAVAGDEPGQLGARLTAESVDTHLQQVRGRLDRYRESSPELVGVEQEMQRTALSWGGRVIDGQPD